MAARSFSGSFKAFRSILEKCLLEEMCLELKIALKNILKNVQEPFLRTPPKKIPSTNISNITYTKI